MIYDKKAIILLNKSDLETVVDENFIREKISNLKKEAEQTRKIRRSEVSSIRKYSGDPDFRKRRAGDPDISGYIKGNVPAWKYFL